MVTLQSVVTLEHVLLHSVLTSVMSSTTDKHGYVGRNKCLPHSAAKNEGGSCCCNTTRWRHHNGSVSPSRLGDLRESHSSCYTCLLHSCPSSVDLKQST
ncbi:hypothetical protein NP493_253g00018 [Ridgeia piscesae]|uniref:Secreted protein n=1 Tax=Ridgeia piscesae TaxID=27915 RepID=A0AAD9UCZ6_RIDPI|nr:hypothetical protein NP493_253g00018 [Ridgeia piscesae]